MDNSMLMHFKLYIKKINPTNIQFSQTEEQRIKINLKKNLNKSIKV